MIPRPRIPLQIVTGRLLLPAVLECPALQIGPRFIEFVIDTGSPSSLLSEREVKRLRIPLERHDGGEVDFGGSRFKKISLPPCTIHLLPEKQDSDESFVLSVSLAALRATKMPLSQEQMAPTLPSILGLNFLREQKLSLHVILTEELAYLQYEG